MPGPPSREIAERFRKFAGQFTDRVEAVSPGAWDNPAPCEGWVARDVVRHLVEWMPGLFFTSTGLPAPDVPPVDENPLAAWEAVRHALQAALDDPEIASRPFESRTMGPMTFAEAVDSFGTPDVFLHAWDLARATGQDERLDPDEVSRLYRAMEPHDELLRQSGHYGPRTPVPDDADEQTKLLAFIGRRP